MEFAVVHDGLALLHWAREGDWAAFRLQSCCVHGAGVHLSLHCQVGPACWRLGATAYSYCSLLLHNHTDLQYPNFICASERFYCFMQALHVEGNPELNLEVPRYRPGERCRVEVLTIDASAVLDSSGQLQPATLEVLQAMPELQRLVLSNASPQQAANVLGGLRALVPEGVSVVKGLGPSDEFRAEAAARWAVLAIVGAHNIARWRRRRAVRVGWQVLSVVSALAGSVAAGAGPVIVLALGVGSIRQA